MSTQSEPQDKRPDDEDSGLFTANGVDVYGSGRVTIPSRFRNRHEIAEDDVVNIRTVGDGYDFWTLHLIVDGKGRVRLPAHKRDLFGVEDGDIIDIVVEPTGSTQADF